MTNTRDAYDDWIAQEPTPLENLTIAEIWMAAYDRGRADEADRHAAPEPEEEPGEEPPTCAVYLVEIRTQIARALADPGADYGAVLRSIASQITKLAVCGPIPSTTEQQP